MWYCTNCGAYFDDDDIGVETMSSESYYGVRDLFSNSFSSVTNCVCPYCGDENIEEVFGEDDDESEALYDKMEQTKKTRHKLKKFDYDED